MRPEAVRVLQDTAGADERAAQTHNNAERHCASQAAAAVARVDSVSFGGVGVGDSVGAGVGDGVGEGVGE